MNSNYRNQAPDPNSNPTLKTLESSPSNSPFEVVRTSQNVLAYQKCNHFATPTHTMSACCFGTRVVFMDYFIKVDKNPAVEFK